jgi:hypothetical protein
MLYSATGTQYGTYLQTKYASSSGIVTFLPVTCGSDYIVEVYNTNSQFCSGQSVQEYWGNFPITPTSATSSYTFVRQSSSGPMNGLPFGIGFNVYKCEWYDIFNCSTLVSPGGSVPAGSTIQPMAMIQNVRNTGYYVEAELLMDWDPISCSGPSYDYTSSSTGISPNSTTTIWGQKIKIDATASWSRALLIKTQACINNTFCITDSWSWSSIFVVQ